MFPDTHFIRPPNPGLGIGSSRTSATILFLAVLPLVLPGVAAAQEPGDSGYTLEELLAIGRERNPMVLALRAEHAALDGDRRDAGRFANPELQYETGTGDPFDAIGSRSVHGFALQQTIENPLVRHHRMSSLRSEVEAAGQSVRSGEADVEYEIRIHFYRILYLRQLLGLARLNEEALEAIRGLIETRAELGEVRELEAIRLRVEHLRSRNQVEAVEMELDQFRRHLNTYLGSVLPDDFILTGELTAEPFHPDLRQVVEETLLRHPTLQGARLEREGAEAKLRATRLRWLPDPVLSGASRTELDGEVRTIGIGLQIPLWNQSRAASDRDRRRVEATENRERAIQLEVEAQLMIHHNHLRLHRQTLSLFEEGLLTEGDASMEIAETSYRQGEISFVEYLDARRTYHSIQIEYQQALFDWNRERAEFDRAAGGGTL
ncbi:TolC family protein [Gemmatimonadota bacterium]